MANLCQLFLVVLVLFLSILEI